MSNYVAQPLEEAFVAYLNEQLASLTWLAKERIYRGIDNPEDQSIWNRPPTLRQYPCVVFYCESAEAFNPNYHGIWKCMIEVQIWTSFAQATAGEHETHCRDVFDYLLTSSIEEDLIAAYHAASVAAGVGEVIFIKHVMPATTTTRFERKAWCTVLNLECDGVGHQAVDQL